MGSWEFERDDFIRDRDSGKWDKQKDIKRVKSALGELGVGIKDVGVDFVAETIESMQSDRFAERDGVPSQQPDLTELIAERLVERALGIER